MGCRPEPRYRSGRLASVGARQATKSRTWQSEEHESSSLLMTPSSHSSVTTSRIPSPHEMEVGASELASSGDASASPRAPSGEMASLATSSVESLAPPLSAEPASSVASIAAPSVSEPSVPASPASCDPSGPPSAPPPPPLLQAAAIAPVNPSSNHTRCFGNVFMAYWLFAFWQSGYRRYAISERALVSPDARSHNARVSYITPRAPIRKIPQQYRSVARKGRQWVRHVIS